ncbi:hypothetical protein DRE_04629 [Drechslerella stenobrocha 248]|uniref:Uncharacterized protein n=1 Tax=Drechslerella stenobrocha 248 TaxID=1043628 RepID=W7IAI1_9PEZI|nr:hypothetical protein DRE_04629 [Drechslerella stenobrocha 248]
MHYSAPAVLLLATPAFAAFNLLNLPGGLDNLPEIPAGTPENPACIAALNATIDCDPVVVTSNFTGSETTSAGGPNESTLNRICTDSCLASLRRWIRGGPGCEGDVLLDYFGLRNSTFYGDDDEEDSGPVDSNDVYQYYITATYFSKCLTDPNPRQGESKFCVLQREPGSNADPTGYMRPSYLNTSNPDALCGGSNTCALASAYLWAPLKTIYKIDPANMTESRREPPMLTLEEACPNVDTSKFPTREANLAQGGSGGNNNNNNNNGGNGGNGGSTNNTGGSPNAAARAGMQGWAVVFAASLLSVAYLV